jgi:IS5 family transposase
LWLFRETLAKVGLIEKLFERFGRHLETKGYIARGGQMVDATIVPVPKQRNSREENDEVKAGNTPDAWKKNPAKNRQKDKDARWTKKHGKSFYGYKNHVNADAKHKLIRQYEVTDASLHDSRKFDGLLNQANTSSDVYADSAYRLPGAPYAGAWHTKQSLLTTNYDLKSPSRRAGDQFDEKIVIVRGAQRQFIELVSPGADLRKRLRLPLVVELGCLRSDHLPHDLP